MQNRLFIALEFPSQIIKKLIIIQQQIQALQLFEGAYVKPEQFHITLTFVGNVDIQYQQCIQKALRAIKYPRFEGHLGGLGVFPNQKNIRIIWVDFNALELLELVQQIKNILKPLVTLEEREFVSHITLARVKKVHNIHALVQYLSDMPLLDAQCKVTEFSLKKSELTSKGSIYYDVEHYLLTS